MTTALIPLNKIRTDGGTQPRADFNHDAIREYSEAMRDGTEFPPIIVFFDGAEHWLSDGFHRLKAADRIGALDIRAEVRQGTQRDAILHSVGANASHGLRRTNADKQRAVKRLLGDEEWAKWSDGEIARRCGVSQPFVSVLRREGTQNGFELNNERKGSDGKTRNVENIGRRPAAAPTDASPPQLPAPPATVGDAAAVDLDELPGAPFDDPAEEMAATPPAEQQGPDVATDPFWACPACGKDHPGHCDGSPFPTGFQADAEDTSCPACAEQEPPLPPSGEKREVDLPPPHNQALHLLLQAQSLLSDVEDANLQSYLKRAVSSVRKLVGA